MFFALLFVDRLDTIQLNILIQSRKKQNYNMHHRLLTGLTLDKTDKGCSAIMEHCKGLHQNLADINIIKQGAKYLYR